MLRRFSNWEMYEETREAGREGGIGIHIRMYVRMYRRVCVNITWTKHTATCITTELDKCNFRSQSVGGAGVHGVSHRELHDIHRMPDTKFKLHKVARHTPWQ